MFYRLHSLHLGSAWILKIIYILNLQTMLCFIRDGGPHLSVLLDAPPIPAGMAKFRWNPQEPTGIHRNGTGIHRNNWIPAGMQIG